MKRKLLLAVLFIACSGVAKAAEIKPSPAALEKGKSSYATNCLMCHGEKGDGNGVAGAMMNPKPRNFIAEKFKKGDKPEKVFKSVSEGLEGTSMVGFSHLPEDERWALTYYILSLKGHSKKN